MIRGALLIALAALLWATTGIVAKFLFSGSDLQAVTLGFLRLAVALPFFFGLMLREQRALARSATSPPKFTRNLWFRLWPWVSSRRSIRAATCWPWI